MNASRDERVEPSFRSRVGAAARPLLALAGLGWLAYAVDLLSETRWIDQGMYGLAIDSLVRSLSLTILAVVGLAIVLQGTRLRAITARLDLSPLRWLSRVVLAVWVALVGGAAIRTLDPPSGPNVVLVVVDALRADHLGAYGYEPSITPALDALAASATVYRNAYSSSTYTVPAMGTLFTSTLPPVHRIARAPTRGGSGGEEDGEELTQVPESYLLLTEVLRNAGWETAAITTIGWISPESNYDQGVDEYILVPRGDAELVEAAEAFVKAPRRRPFFLYLHFIDLHDYFRSEHLFPAGDPRPDDLSAVLAGFEGQRPREIYRALNDDAAALTSRDVAYLLEAYDRWLRRTDELIGRLIETIDRQGSDTVVVLTSDHGEQFGEHGRLVHGGDAFYNEVLAIPMIVRHPGRGAGEVVSEPVGLVDLAPMVSAAVGIEPHALFQGMAEPAARDAAVATDGRTWKLLSGGLSLITSRDPERVELYDLTIDPGETVDLAGRPERQRDVERLQDRLAEILRESLRHRYQESAGPRAGAMSDETRDRLRALGYLD